MAVSMKEITMAGPAPGWTRTPRDGRAGGGEDAGSDDGADPQEGKVPTPQGPL